MLFLLPGGGGIDPWLSRYHVKPFAIKPVLLEAVASYLWILFSKSIDSAIRPVAGAAASVDASPQGDLTAVEAGSAVVVDSDAKRLDADGLESKIVEYEVQVLTERVNVLIDCAS